MSNHTKKIILLTGIFSILISVFLLVSNILENKRLREIGEQRVYLNIYMEANDKEPYWDAFYPLQEMRTVLDVLEYADHQDQKGMGNVNFIIKWDGTESKILSILGIDNGNEKEWTFLVNGKKSALSPNKYFVQYGDVIDLRYMKP